MHQSVGERTLTARRLNPRFTDSAKIAQDSAGTNILLTTAGQMDFSRETANLQAALTHRTNQWCNITIRPAI